MKITQTDRILMATGTGSNLTIGKQSNKRDIKTL